jgi:hypothetical protein
MESELTDPENITYFIMGILSNWLPKIKDLYLKIKKIKHFFDPCYVAITKTLKMIRGTSVESDPAKKEDHDKEQAKIQEDIQKQETRIQSAENDDNAKPEKKAKACKETKELLEKIFTKAYNQRYSHLSKNERDANMRGIIGTNNPKLCETALSPESEKAQKLIKKNFDNEEHYSEVCKIFRETGDCGNFNPDNSKAWNYIKKTLKYGLLVLSGGKCMFNLIKGGGVTHNVEISSLASTAIGTWAITKSVFKEFGSFLLHIFTFGVWGVIRAAWNILILALKMKILISNFVEDIPFKLGELVGLGIKIAKALVSGRRKK